MGSVGTQNWMPELHQQLQCHLLHLLHLQAPSPLLLVVDQLQESKLTQQENRARLKIK